jgi:single-strand DNA-binding protein
LNKVILLGHLTKDPEVRHTQSAEPLTIAKYTLAVKRRFRKEGEPDADFLNCVSFGKQAEFVEKHYKKGMQIGVAGRISTRSYDDPTTGVRKFVTEIIVDESEFTESKAAYEYRMAQNAAYAEANPDRASAHSPAAAPPPAKAPPYEPEGFSAITDSIDDDDLPF